MIRSRFLSLVVLALSSQAALAHAQSAEGTGRITLSPGWRLTPNDFFYAHAAEAGHPKAADSPGGPGLTGSFAYSATNEIEIGIELFGTGERLSLEGVSPLTSITYGGLIGLRFQAPGLLMEALVPSVGLFTGPTLVYTTGADSPVPVETFTNGYAATVGAQYRLTERFGIGLEYRFLLVRGYSPDFGSINGGGHFFSLGVTLYFPNETTPTPTFR